ncbi:hypothetical protein C5167_047141 [Papaver somniferum]|uniref:Uncharacterized protein n=1 Tax=Papaver somniferum TaxID=3469 RepID=A0A4Y7LFS1_PAPSO|nr:hypothetical protein C5167_047141 [Papaver somniferum]
MSRKEYKSLKTVIGAYWVYLAHFKRGICFIFSQLHITEMDCERDIAEAGDDAPDEVKNENIIKLSRALVHTRQPEDVQ